jgi:hypothetical protein
MSKANLLHSQEDKRIRKKKTQAFHAFQRLTRNNVSERWQVSIMTLKRMERAGLLPALKLGRSVRYRLEDIERIEAEAEVR